MEKSYKTSCKSVMYALAIIVAGACTLAQPAFGLSCFLPSGNCGGGGVGISNQDDCSKYKISKDKYESEYMNECWSCSGCNDKKTNVTTYSCTLKSSAELGDWVWKNQKCCKNGNCGNCQPPLKWDDDSESCVCENAGEIYHSDGNMCCPSGQSPSEGICCPSGQHNSNNHCCPRDQEYNGTECVCKEPLIGDGNGGCRSRDCTGYNLSSPYDSKCFDCETCPDDETKIKCTAKTLGSSWEVNADTGACRLKSCSDLGYLTGSGSCDKNQKKNPVDNVEASDGPCYSCGDQTCEQINDSYRTFCSSSEITHKTEDAGSDGPCVTCEADPCDSSYNQENKLDENCFSCTQCTKTGSHYEGKWNCTQNVKENYIVENGTTCRLKTCKEINSDYETPCPTGYVCRDTKIDGSDGRCFTTQACTYGTEDKCKQAGEWVGSCKQDSDGCWWPETCNNAKGYAKQASECGAAFATGAQAGKLGKDGSGAACYRIGCNESAGYYADLGSYDTTVFKEASYPGCGLTCKQPSCVKDITSASQCGTSGTLGHKLSNPKTLKNVTCYTCEDLACNSPYKTDVTKATCIVDNGYTLSTDTQYAGDNACSKCDIKPCEGDYKTAYQTAADCPAVTGQKVTGVTFNGKSGGKACGLCQYDKLKTCADYNRKAAGECGSGYTEQPIFTSEAGEQCVICNKIETCTYPYFEATLNNTCGTRGNLNKDGICARNTCCYANLSKVASIDIRYGSPNVMPIYNKISNKSDSCVRNGTTYYEKLCDGTPKDLCALYKSFTPNGCVSDAYNHDYEVKGTQWGTCSCDTAKGQYDTPNACHEATGKGCTKSTSEVDSCYQTCESKGYYSTEAACKQGLPSGYRCLTPGAAQGNSNCYVRNQPGFAIRYASTPKRNWTCDPRGGGTSTQQTFRAWLSKVTTASNGTHQPGSYAETLDGVAYGELSDNEYRYEAGTYFVCVSNGAAYSNARVGVRKAVVQYTRSANGADPTTHVCFADTISSQFSNTECLKSISWGSGYSCREVTFSEGVLYLVSIYGDYGYPGWTYDMGTCTNY